MDVTSVVWGAPGEQHEAQACAVKELGHGHRFMQVGDEIPEVTEVLLIQGPYGPLRPLAMRLLNSPELRRRLVTIYWFQQNIAVGLPRIARTVAPAAVHALSSWEPDRASARALHRLVPARLRTPGGRIENLGSIRWLHHHGLVNVQAFSSTVFQEFLAAEGIHGPVVPRGYHSLYGERRHLERDVSAVWLGKTRSRRRRRIVYGLRDQLRADGLDMRIHDGIERPFIFGEPRTALLNRTKFVINAHVRPSDEISIRHFIAMANGAVVLSEPNRNWYPFRAGEHYLECEPDQFASTIREFEHRSGDREAMADRAEELITSRLRLSSTISELLGAAQQILSAKDLRRGAI